MFTSRDAYRYFHVSTQKLRVVGGGGTTKPILPNPSLGQFSANRERNRLLPVDRKLKDSNHWPNSANFAKPNIRRGALGCEILPSCPSYYHLVFALS